jgi:hypothetical protein
MLPIYGKYFKIYGNLLPIDIISAVINMVIFSLVMVRGSQHLVMSPCGVFTMSITIDH